MMLYLTKLGARLKQTAQSWLDHDAPRIGAALAFYTLLAFAPLVLLTITVGSFVFKNGNLEGQVIQQVNELAGTEAALLAQEIIDRPRTPSSGAGASVLGIVTLLIGASGIFAELRSALNTMWAIPAASGNGIVQWIKSRLFSIGMVLAGGFLLMVSLVVSAVFAAIGKYLGGILPAPAYMLEALNFLISLAGSAALFALILRYVPDERLPWRTISSGAIVTAFLFTVGKSLIGIYLGRSAIGSPYGPGGSVLVVMAWVYYSAQIFLFGAEFTRVLGPRAPAKRAGDELAPA
jgi:membrane protein